MEAPLTFDEKLMTVQPMDEGVYFGLDEVLYREDPSLGSSDMHLLARNPSDYWFHSYMNPRRPPRKDTEATIRGTAVHVLVLYGEAEFDARYMRGAEHEEWMTPSEKGALTKRANEAAARAGKIALPAVTYDNIAIASAMIAKNPHLATALVGGFNEVSIFWRCRRTGIPKKARIDCLKPRGVGDLKSIANKYGKPFPLACRDTLQWDRRDIQAKHYLDARAEIPRLAAAGRVSGQHDEEAFKLVVAAKRWAWQWVWWQAEGAPITFSLILSPGNPILDMAAASIERAENNYLDYMRRFGPSEMWTLQEEPREAEITELSPRFGADY